jgi:GntR family transcriptional regulator
MTQKVPGMPIWLDVNPRSGVPIYVQIVEQVKHALEVGSLQPGEQLPTVRQLASELTIAPNTIVKAYSELQRMGLIESRPGVGTVVASDLDSTLRKYQVEALFERLHALVRDAAGLGIGEEELTARFQAEVARFYRELTSTGEGEG